MDKKQQLRNDMRVLRKTLPQRKDQETAIHKHLISYLLDRNHKGRILSYLAVQDELDLEPVHQMCLQSGLSLAVPKVLDWKAGIMEFFEWPKDGVFNENRVGILEPRDTATVEPATGDIVLVPCLAIDKRGYRLGYGGGFYDRFLAKHPDLTTICPVFDKQFISRVPAEPYDQPIQFACLSSGLTSLNL
ncbi:5-formyltetrahydrofolate cyclo-ligase [Pseudobacteriovorax antillogorgiicola]|uniref:5-formyltetrahydrofolate cyclo-ligase n=1 Tax=Pseudobacteriovorax antillogorgiicola TaxID=1513793 RepID=A0A1Y6BA67_9BACT|nr:5-formyltetrahydrofolate cyclo-ligase [Pseudobacteriovorax antillogorgiicola]TCS57589.1 5-formyltetrahydrofolate cyclo-ligase [Pseudobacteriovorax antillogorgiicola]SME99535.1 5-formyltetrahydrofolate cyclo-ligase [Pseudobacteriovorax antillogorgiicola]